MYNEVKTHKRLYNLGFACDLIRECQKAEDGYSLKHMYRAIFSLSWYDWITLIAWVYEQIFMIRFLTLLFEKIYMFR